MGTTTSVSIDRGGAGRGGTAEAVIPSGVDAGTRTSRRSPPGSSPDRA